MHMPGARALVASGALVIGLGAGGYAYAEAGSETINGCYNTSNGSLRVLTSGQCRTSETAVSWNKTGPQGEQGPQGERGEQGEQGEQGMLSSVGTSSIAFSETLEQVTYLDATKSVTVWCGPGDEAVSGGIDFNQMVWMPTIVQSTRTERPDGTSGWTFRFTNLQNFPLTVTGTAYAYCAAG